MNIISDVDLKIIKRIPFESVDFVFDALHDAFHPNGLENKEPDTKFLALWNLFLHTVGWTDEEYWDEYDSHCGVCGKRLPAEETKMPAEPTADSSKKPN